MNRRSQAFIGATVVVIGLGVVALGYFEDESTVRYVEDLNGDPAAHGEGTYTLMGILQPPQLVTAGADGTTQTAPNDQWQPAITTSERFQRDGADHIRNHKLEAESQDGVIHWRLTTTEQRTDRAAPVGEPSVQEWTSTGTLLQVRSFETDATVWTVFDGTAQELLRKPSQFTGRLATDVPDGAIVFEATSLTQQCSSKFLPPDVAAEYDKDGDGVTD